MKPSWGETLSEWTACAGLGLIPLFLALAIAGFTDSEAVRSSILTVEFISRELILFCIVTNAASIVVFISKFNLLQTAAPRARKIPVALVFLLLLLSLGCSIVIVMIAIRHSPPTFFAMLSCLLTTVPLSLWAERRIGLLAHP
jgi:hypothetical protein